MRLLLHNILMCRFCEAGYPLTIEAHESDSETITEYNEAMMRSICKKLDWDALESAAKMLGLDVPVKEDSDDFLRKLKKVVYDYRIVQGQLKCPNCSAVYPVNKGVPDMIRGVQS
eukprot:Trichotokara_eunicae@DN3387_c0_g1_i3.p1